MNTYRVIVGLGNPGTKYQGSRHNIGFACVDEFLNSAAKYTSNISAPGNWQDKFRGQVQNARFNSESLFILKPQTFMNLSGEAVAELCNFCKIAAEEVVVVHDDIDLPVGTIRIKQGGSDAGHNGLKSITQCLGSSNYVRVRFGVGRPGGNSSSGATLSEDEVLANAKTANIPVVDWVLGKFNSGDLELVIKTQKLCVLALVKLLESGMAAARDACGRG